MKNKLKWKIEEIPMVKDCTFYVEWSKEDLEHVGLCKEYPSLSWMDKDPVKAMEGIKFLVDEYIDIK